MKWPIASVHRLCQPLAWLLCLLFLQEARSVAQVCSSTVAPTGLSSSYFPGAGALLQWNPIPGSIGARIYAASPGGFTIVRTIIATEPDQYLVPDAYLGSGLYQWMVRAACSPSPPYALTPLSMPDTFVVPGSVLGCGTVLDLEGNAYPTAVIGGQCWMASNLRTQLYQNGDSIPSGLSDSAWLYTTVGAMAVYDDDPANMLVYGALYSGYAARDPRGICPSGWHVPISVEWIELVDELGGTSAAGGRLKAIGTLGSGTGLWLAPNAGATDASGFSALPGGRRWGSGDYLGIGQQADYWTASEVHLGSTQRFWTLYYNETEAFDSYQLFVSGMAIRCVQD